MDLTKLKMLMSENCCGPKNLLPNLLGTIDSPASGWQIDDELRREAENVSDERSRELALKIIDNAYRIDETGQRWEMHFMMEELYEYAV